VRKKYETKKTTMVRYTSFINLFFRIMELKIFSPFEVLAKW